MNIKILITHCKKVVCTGETLPIFGHPKVYLKIDNITNKVICPYCSINYIYENIQE